MNEESQKYIAVIFKEWLPLYDSLTPDVRALLKKMADERSSMLATRFYDFIFQDPDIARHLSYELVEERLSRSLAGWVQQILTCEKRIFRLLRSASIRSAAFIRGLASRQRRCCAARGR